MLLPTVCCLLVAGALAGPAHRGSSPEPRPQRDFTPEPLSQKDFTPEPLSERDISTVPFNAIPELLNAIPEPGTYDDPSPEPKLLDTPLDKTNPSAIPLSLSVRASYVLAEGRYSLRSPNYPDRYPNNFDASLDLTGEDGQDITIGCSDFSVEYHYRCRYDYLRINDVRYCGSGTISGITSSQLRIRFYTDYSVRRRGFYCLITVPAGGGGGGTTASTTTSGTTTTSAPGDVCCGIANTATGRIVGGVETGVNELPWQAALVSRGNNRPFCGGTVINTLWILTAAHCTGSTASSLQVLLRKHNLGADSNQIRRDVAQIVRHPSYRFPNYDFTLLRLTSAIDFASLNNEVAPACLPTGGAFVDVDAIVSGWGTTSSGGSQPSALRKVTVQTMSNTECRGDLGSSISSNMICADVDAGGKDSCQGDSGGPLVTDVGGRYTLIGVVSWGYGCAERNRPGVYARVTAVSSWISQTTAGASLC